MVHKSNEEIKNCPLISVIIPVYNGEKFLSNCIDKLCKIRNAEIEIIVVNDGSTDSTDSIAKSYNDDIKYFQKPNGGVSSARNTRIEKATGRYITFLDVDDELPEGAIEYYCEAIRNYPDYECIQGCFSGSLNETDVPPETIDSKTLQLMCLENPRCTWQCDEKMRPVARGTHGCYGKLYSTEFIRKNNLRFIEGLGLGEDLLFYLNVLHNVKRVLVLYQCVYTIIGHADSATRSVNEKMPVFAGTFSDTLMQYSWVREDIELYAATCYQVNMHVNMAVSCWFSNYKNEQIGNLNIARKQFDELLSRESIEEAYQYLSKNEKSLTHRLKYVWLSHKFLLGLYLVFFKRGIAK